MEIQPPLSGITVLAQSGAAVSCDADTNEKTLATITVPANSMGANGRIEVTTHWECTNSANNKTFKVKFGGTAYLNLVNTTVAQGQLLTMVQNANATGAQVGMAAGTFPFATSSAAKTTSSVDTTADVTVLITGQKASAGETLTLVAYSAKLFK